MFQVMEDGIYEQPTTTLTTTHTGIFGGTSTIEYQPYTWWSSYPVYVCHDKTKKAIEVLKALQKDKVLTCNSVPRFIELVEKISGLL
jgi:hypothetical protein